MIARSTPEPTIRPLAESGLLVELGDEIDPAVVARVMALTAALDADDLAGVRDVVPAYTTVLIAFDPSETDGETLADAVRRLATDPVATAGPPARTVTIPVAYGGDHGPDLPAVAAHANLGRAEVIARHAAGEYTVASMGFAPGFGFLLGLPPELATPRRAEPRTRVPAGSVGIGGAQTGIYPLATPGGWHLIGRTPLRLFDPAREEPFLLHPGDQLRFQPIEPGEYDAIAAAETDGASDDSPGDQRPLPPSPLPMPAKATDRILRVLEPGLLTTVQDLGRPGSMRFGVTPGGALDRAALILGNRLVGNEPDAAGLEMTLIGPRIRFDMATVVALTGADLGGTLNGASLPLWRPVAVAAGDEIGFRPPEAGASGARAYLCVAGGIDVAPVLGGRSADLFGGFGGGFGRALQAGDELPLGEAALPAAEILRRRLVAPPPRHDAAVPVRVVLGPQRDRFTDEGISTVLDGEYEVSPKADRMGLRLVGPAITHSRGADLISEGIAHGAVQVPGDGRPIVLLAGRQTVGGYPKIATVAGADLDGLGQRRPGDAVRFAAVDLAAAREIALAYLRALKEDAVTTTPRAVPGWSAPATADTADGQESAAAAWTPEGIERVVAALRDADVTDFRLELAAIGLTLDMRRGDAGAPSPAPVATEPSPAEPDDAVVRAPLLGVFYRRPAPDQPPFVEEGARLDAGTVIGVLEVMKTYHEVTAPRPALLAEFLVADGQYVEYGQPIARLVPD